MGFKRGLDRATGLKDEWQKNSAADRAAVRKTRDAMVDTLKKDIVRAIQKGEADRKAVEELANANNVFVTVQGNRKKIADNYLSLKAYASTAADKITDYLAKGKGRNLSSIGDLLGSVAGLSKVKVKAAPGEGFGSPKIPLIFSGKNVKINGAISKINGLVNEYIKTIGQVRSRWPMGLGKYLVAKLETAMQSTGALEVDKVADKAGNYVFVNGHAVGLSSKLSDFASLAVHMTAYERTLARLTGKLSNAKHAGKVMVKPPEWEGN